MVWEYSHTHLRANIPTETFNTEDSFYDYDLAAVDTLLSLTLKKRLYLSVVNHSRVHLQDTAVFQLISICLVQELVWAKWTLAAHPFVGYPSPSFIFLDVMMIVNV